MNECHFARVRACPNLTSKERSTFSNMKRRKFLKAAGTAMSLPILLNGFRLSAMPRRSLFTPPIGLNRAGFAGGSNS